MIVGDLINRMAREIDPLPFERAAIAARNVLESEVLPSDQKRMATAVRRARRVLRLVERERPAWATLPIDQDLAAAAARRSKPRRRKAETAADFVRRMVESYAAVALGAASRPGRRRKAGA